MNSKSKKINQYIENYEMMQSTLSNGRYAQAWKDIETGIYYYDAGYEGMPADYHEEHDSVNDLEHSMRGFADLRKWNYRNF